MDAVAAEDRANDEYEAVKAARDRALPQPPDEAWLFENDKRIEVYDPEDLRPGGFHWNHHSHLPPASLLRIRDAVDAYAEAKAVVDAQLGVELVWNKVRAAEDETELAGSRARASQPANVFELAVKCRFASWWGRGKDLEAPDDVQEELTSDAGILRVELYRDAMALAGLVSATAQVKRFDPEAFIAEFEAIPGHQIGLGGPCYINSLAWGGPADEEFLVSDPDAIKAYDHHVETAIFAGQPGFKAHCGGPMMLVQKQAIDWSFPHDAAERARLHDLWERRRMAMLGDPIGQPLWTALPRWKRKAVVDFVKDRKI